VKRSGNDATRPALRSPANPCYQRLRPGNAGCVIEKALTVDNVFALIFLYFAAPLRYQAGALLERTVYKRSHT
jgi:hypothetical protein